MNSTLFSDAMSELNDKYITEAELYKSSKKTSRIITWSAVAACICIMITSTIIVSTHAKSSVTGADSSGAAGDGVLESDILSITMNRSDSVPEFCLPCLREDIRTPMNTDEMFAYYGLTLPDTIKSEYSEAPSAIPHGLYSFSDGTFDLNDFCFERTADHKEFNLFITKNSSFGSYLIGDDTSSFTESTVNMVKVIFVYCESAESYYARFTLNGCDCIAVTHFLNEAEFIEVIKSIISVN